MKYKSNPEIKERYKKRYQENQKLHKKIKNQVSEMLRKEKKVVIRLRIFFNKLYKAPMTFAQYAIEACINGVSDFLNERNIELSLQTCNIQ